MIEVIYTLAGIGVLFNFLGGLGIIRFPDVYNRLHASTMCTTFGTFFIAASIIAYCIMNWNTPNTVMAFHTGIAATALFLTNPTASHAIAKAAYKSGVMPHQAVIDKYKEVKK